MHGTMRGWTSSTHTSHTALPETRSRTTAILSFIGPTTADKPALQLCGSESLQYCSEQSTPTVTLPPCPLGWVSAAPYSHKESRRREVRESPAAQTVMQHLPCHTTDAVLQGSPSVVWVGQGKDNEYRTTLVTFKPQYHPSHPRRGPPPPTHLLA